MVLSVDAVGAKASYKFVVALGRFGRLPALKDQEKSFAIG